MLIVAVLPSVLFPTKKQAVGRSGGRAVNDSSRVAATTSLAPTPLPPLPPGGVRPGARRADGGTPRLSAIVADAHRGSPAGRLFPDEEAGGGAMGGWGGQRQQSRRR